MGVVGVWAGAWWVWREGESNTGEGQRHIRAGKEGAGREGKGSEGRVGAKFSPAVGVVCLGGYRRGAGRGRGGGCVVSAPGLLADCLPHSLCGHYRRGTQPLPAWLCPRHTRLRGLLALLLLGVGGGHGVTDSSTQRLLTTPWLLRLRASLRAISYLQLWNVKKYGVVSDRCRPP